MNARRLIRELERPGQFFMKVIHRYPGVFRWMKDEPYLRFFFRIVMGENLNIKEPRTFNEKLQWLKLYERKDIYTTMVDKYAVKQHVAEQIGEKYIIPTLGVWDSFDDIDFDSLPNRFVLKCTHDSGGLVICKDKNCFDKKSARKKINRSLRNNFYWFGREWPYKNVKPHIIAEKYLEDIGSNDLRDYKLFCFNGVPRIALVCSERFGRNGLKEDFFDEHWERLEIQRPSHECSDMPIPCPRQYVLMKELASKLSTGIPFVRIDFYAINDDVYFGEMTFYPASGFEGFNPNYWDTELGKWITLPKRGD